VTATVPDVDTAVARALARLGRRVEQSTEQRNDLIRQAVADGAGIREVARAVGLAPATVLNILSPRKR
jgi:transposase-like protein